MTNRSRSHYLEEQSIAAIHRNFPMLWSIENYRNDYGIDCQVEIFDDDKKSTGLRFYIQLKATDKEESLDSLQLDSDHFIYWTKQNDPVVLIRFFQKIDELSWCWIHDLHWRLKSDKNTIDVSSFLRKWDTTSPDEIKGYLTTRRNAFTQNLLPPYTVSLNFSLDNKKKKLRIISGIQKHLDKSNFSILTNQPATITLNVTKDKVTTVLLGLPGVTIPFEKSISDTKVIDLSILSLFMTSCRYEKIILSRNIISSCLSFLYETAKDEFIGYLFDGLILTFGITSTFRILREQFSISATKASWLYGETTSWVTILDEISSSSKNTEGMSTIFYNLGNSLINIGRWSDALVAYTKVRECDPSYAKRDYFLKELGIINLELGNLEEAFKIFKQVCDNDNTPIAKIYLATILFKLGKFKEAASNFSKLDLSTSVNPHEKFLIANVCIFLVTEFNVSTNNPVNAAPPPSQKLPEHILKKSISSFDLLNPTVAFNLAFAAETIDNYRCAMFLFMLSALICPEDDEAWASSILNALHSQSDEIFNALLFCSYRFCGTSVIERINSALDNAPSLKMKYASVFDDLQNELAQKTTFTKNTLTIRINSNNESLSISV